MTYYLAPTTLNHQPFPIAMHSTEQEGSKIQRRHQSRIMQRTNIQSKRESKKKHFILCAAFTVEKALHSNGNRKPHELQVIQIGVKPTADQQTTNRHHPNTRLFHQTTRVNVRKNKDEINTRVVRNITSIERLEIGH